MRHIKYQDKTRAERTPEDWLPIGAQIMELVHKWANRSDILVFVGEGATGGVASALFRPDIAEVEINTKIAFGEFTTPAQIGDVRDRATQYEFPVAMGMLRHEALHARYSRWDMQKAYDELDKDVYAALTALEESRIEALGVRIDKTHKAFLRASGLKIVLGDITEAEEDVKGNAEVAMSLMAYIAGRVIAGVLEHEDVAHLLDLVKQEIGEDTYNRLSDILFEFQAHRNHSDMTAVYPLAEEWARILKDLKPEQEEGEEGDKAEGGSESSAGAGSGTSKEFMDAVMDALADAAEEVMIASARDLAEQQEREDWAEKATAAAAEGKEKAENEVVADKVFSKGTQEMPVTRTQSRLVHSRSPRPEERVAAVTVARMLEKAKYRERDVTVVSTNIPEGRLRPRALVQGAAQRAAGRVAKVEPWRKKVRKHTEEPKLSVGVMVDISGSMGGAMESMATTAWVMSEATKRVQGRCAMVYYGNDVFPTLRAGEHLDQVDVYSANDATEKFDIAFRALDGSLNFLHSDGARLLVIVSDGHYTPNERVAAAKWMKRCRQAGVGVLWLTFDGKGADARAICEGTDVVIMSDSLNPASVATSIGRAAASAMEAVGQRNA